MRFNLLIEHQCLQCGAPAVLQETDRLFDCEFCRVKSYLVARGAFRYVLPDNAPSSKNLIFFPYWRFKGMYFSDHLNGAEHRVIDFTQQAKKSPLFPISLGLRSQALKLKFVTPRLDGYFIKPDQTIEHVFQQIDGRLNASRQKPIYHQTHIGETLSLIYSPFYVEDKLYDAILNKPISKTLSMDFDPVSLPGGGVNWHIRFIPTLCPTCGWDMIGERNSLVLHCKNCSSTWRPDQDRFEQIKAAHIQGDEAEKTTYLPFWRVKPDISGLKLNSYADLVQLANIPKVVQKGWEDIQFYFWIPAFKIRPRLFLRIIRHITLSQPRRKLALNVPKNGIYPVTMPLREALESLKLNLTMIAKPKKDILTRLHEINVTPKSYLLVYLPFTQSQHDFIQTDCQLAINKNALTFGKQL